MTDDTTRATRRQALIDAGAIDSTDQPKLEDQPTSGASFWARTRKAFAGGIVGAATGGVGSAITQALADGSISGADAWGIVSIALGGFIVGYGTVWRVPNAA